MSVFTNYLEWNNSSKNSILLMCYFVVLELHLVTYLSSLFGLENLTATHIWNNLAGLNVTCIRWEYFLPKICVIFSINDTQDKTL